MINAGDRTGRNWLTHIVPLYLALAVGIALPLKASSEPAPSGYLLSSGDQTHFLEALRLAEKGNWSQAQRRIRQTGHALPQKILQWMEYTQRVNAADFDEISSFIRANPDWPRQRSLRRSAERAIDESVSALAMIRWFRDLPPLTGHGMTALGEALIATGEPLEGRRWILRAWLGGRFDRRRTGAFLRKHGNLITPADRWARVDNLLWRGRTRAAQASLQYVSRDLRALATARIKLRRSRGGVDGALSQVPRKLQSDQGLLFERFRWRVRKGRDDDALAILPGPDTNLRRPEIWVDERLRLARRLLGKGRVTDAWRVIKDHNVPIGFRAQYAEAEWLAGWVALRFLNEHDEAFRRFEKLYGVVRFPVSRARAAYWAGRAARASKRSRVAAIWFHRSALHPTTYHGQLASLALGQPARLTAAAPPPSTAEETAFRKKELVQAVLILDQAGQYKRLSPFMLRLSELAETHKDHALIGNLAREIGRPDLGVWISRRAHRRGIVMLDHGYPLVPMPDGKPEKALLLALSRQESNFDRRAISHAGARGIMQLMPSTARGVARWLRLRYSRNRLTSDPSYNVRLGRAYLKEMLERFDGSYVLSIASYNAGPYNVGRWIRRNGDPRDTGMDPVDWIELIPFNETRNYVQRVLGNLQVYRLRLPPGKVTVTLTQDLRR